MSDDNSDLQIKNLTEQIYELKIYTGMAKVQSHILDLLIAQRDHALEVGNKYETIRDVYDSIEKMIKENYNSQKKSA